MNIQTAIELVGKLDINLCQLYYLESVYNKQENISLINSNDLNDLIEQGYLYNGEVTKLRDKGRSLFEGDQIKTLFEEFYTLFPIKTPSGRRLRASSMDSMNGDKVWVLFKRKIKTEEDYKGLIKGLANELKERETNNSLEYINNIITWLRNNTWEMYDSDDSEEIVLDVM